MASIHRHDLWLIPLPNRRSAGRFYRLIAAWAVAVGILLILWGWRIREAISTEWLVIALEILSLLFGVTVFGNVQAGYRSLQLIFAIYMAVGGILAIALAFQVRSIGVRLGAVG